MMGEVMGKRELKKIQARKKIMEAALQQFRENGFQTASVADIMKTAENTKVQYVIVEQDQHPERGSLEDAKLSIEYLKSLGY